ncbi:aminopeptidase P family protein [Candidatus Woesearchaeota archaeon]|nr:aminopeptidase P family protein [Candidatus Woesearchaeota archaeon]
MKIQELQSVLRKKEVDCAVFLNTSLEKKDPLVRYFSGLDIELLFVVIPAKGEGFVITSSLDVNKAKQNSRIKNVYAFETRLDETLRKHIKTPKVIAVNFDFLTKKEEKFLKKVFKKTKIVDVSVEANQLRETKTTKEITYIRKACGVGDEVFKETIHSFASFKTENDVKKFIEEKIRNKGFEPAFETQVNTASNASFAHYKTSKEKLRNGFCIMDFGVRVNGYISDMSRTIYVGNPSEKEIKVYENLRSLQEKTISSVELGFSYAVIDDIPRSALGEKLIHATGHGVGLQVHENPRVGPNSQDQVLEGHVFTIEPGEYVKGEYGIRIEDTILVTKKGVEVLTKSTKDLVMVGL